MRRIYTTLWISGVNGSFRIMPNSCLSQNPNLMFFLNPRDEGSVCCHSFTRMSVGCFAGLYGTSWPKEKRYRPWICYTHSPWPYLKTSFLFFFRKKLTMRVASHEKLRCHGDFLHYSSIALFLFIAVHAMGSKRLFYYYIKWNSNKFLLTYQCRLIYFKRCGWPSKNSQEL